MCQAESAEFKAKTKEIYWPILRSSLLNGDLGIQDLDLDCPICYTNMGVHPDNYGPKNEYGHNHRAIILACGHTVGNSCAYLGDLKACPICRANLTHACCGHRHKGNSIPWEIKELDSIPQDLNWGGFIPGSCNSCVARQSLHMLMEWIAWSAPLSRLPAATTSNRE